MNLPRPADCPFESSHAEASSAVETRLKESFKPSPPPTGAPREQGQFAKFANYVGIRFGILMAAAGLGTGVVCDKALGAIVPTAADIPAAEALGAAQNDTVWVKGQAVGTIYFSGTLIRGQEHDYVLTVAHGVKFASSTFSPSQITVGNGTSYKNDLGATSGISAIYVSPTFVPGSDSGLDYAILQLTNRISLPNLVFRIALTPQYGNSVLFAGFGVPGAMSGEQVPNNGNVMGFYGGFSTAGAWNDANDSGNFTGSNDSAVGSSQDSGGSVKAFNYSTGRWESLGTMVAGSPSSTTFLNYNNVDQYFHDILNTVIRPVVPGPGVISLAILAISVSTTTADHTFRTLRTKTISYS